MFSAVRPGSAGTRSNRAAEAVTVTAAMLWLVAAHASTIGYRKYANVDEAYASALAERLLEGFRLYEGAISQRGPLMYYAYAAIARLVGWDNILGLRIVALAYELLLVALVYWSGRRLLDGRVGALAAAITSYAIAFGVPPDDGLALNGETLLMPALVVGATWGAVAMRHAPGSIDRMTALLGSGLMMGAAACIKQSSLLHPLPVVAWLLASARFDRRSGVALARDLGAIFAGLVVFPACFAAQAASQGTLSRLVYYCFTYNREVHLRPNGESGIPMFVLEHLHEYPLFATATVGAVATSIGVLAARVRIARRRRRLRALVAHFGVLDYLWLHFLAGFLPATALRQFFAHYYLVVTPFLALVVAFHVVRRMGHTHRSALPRNAFIAGLALWTCAGISLALQRERIDGRVTHDDTVERAAQYIAAQTTPEDRIFVWGFSPWLYGYSHRRPAGRYVFATYVTGFVPWFWNALDREAARVVPGSMDDLLGDLEREKPAVVVDAGSVTISRPLRAYEPLARWIHREYCFDARIGAFDVYKRRNGEECACYPLPAATVDYFGKPLSVPTPPVVDAAEARPVAPGPRLEPRRCASPSAMQGSP